MTEAAPAPPQTPASADTAAQDQNETGIGKPEEGPSPKEIEDYSSLQTTDETIKMSMIGKIQELDPTLIGPGEEKEFAKMSFADLNSQLITMMVEKGSLKKDYEKKTTDSPQLTPEQIGIQKRRDADAENAYLNDWLGNADKQGKLQDVFTEMREKPEKYGLTEQAQKTNQTPEQILNTLSDEIWRQSLEKQFRQDVLNQNDKQMGSPLPTDADTKAKFDEYVKKCQAARKENPAEKTERVRRFLEAARQTGLTAGHDITRGNDPTELLALLCGQDAYRTAYGGDFKEQNFAGKTRVTVDVFQTMLGWENSAKPKSKDKAIWMEACALVAKELYDPNITVSLWIEQDDEKAMNSLKDLALGMTEASVKDPAKLNDAMVKAFEKLEGKHGDTITPFVKGKHVVAKELVDNMYQLGKDPKHFRDFFNLGQTKPSAVPKAA